MSTDEEWFWLRMHFPPWGRIIGTPSFWSRFHPSREVRASANLHRRMMRTLRAVLAEEARYFAQQVRMFGPSWLGVVDFMAQCWKKAIEQEPGLRADLDQLRRLERPESGDVGPLTHARERVPELLADLAGPPHPAVFLGAMDELRRNPPGPEHVPELVEILDMEHDYSWHRMIELDDPRAFAAAFLGRMGPRAVDAVGALCHALDAADPGVREAAADALGRIGEASATPALASCLGDESARVRLAVVTAAWRLGAEPKPLLGALASLLQNEDSCVRQRALETVAEMGPGAAGLICDLRALCREEDESVREAALTALNRLQRPGGRRTL